MILSIPLSVRLPPDHLMWHYDSKGLFSVKSAYKVAISLHDNASSSSQSSLATSTRNKIWSASVPGKVKVCVWKACSNILPTHSNFEKKKGWRWTIFVSFVIPFPSSFLLQLEFGPKAFGKFILLGLVFCGYLFLLFHLL